MVTIYLIVCEVEEIKSGCNDLASPFNINEPCFDMAV